MSGVLTVERHIASFIHGSNYVVTIIQVSLCINFRLSKTKSRGEGEGEGEGVILAVVAE